MLRDSGIIILQISPDMNGCLQIFYHHITSSKIADENPPNLEPFRVQTNTRIMQNFVNGSSWYIAGNYNLMIILLQDKPIELLT